MTQKRIKIVIDNDGTFEFEATGYDQYGCRTTTEALAQVINGEMEDEESRNASDDNPLQYLNI